ncbi:RsmE family RNA methyltransferase [Bacteroidota bacterium]
MEYYYTERKNIFNKTKELIFTGKGYQHLAKVLRKKRGDQIEVTDGELNVYKCEIKSIDKDKIVCIIIGKEFDIHESKRNVTLFISNLKNMSRFEMAIEKAVELGVKNIYPVITEHTINKKSLSFTRLKRLKSIIISAMEQSQRCYLPKIHSSQSFDEMIKTSDNAKQKIVMYESADSKSKISMNKKEDDVALLIGPEGGFSKNEIEVLKKNNWQVRSLGSRKLRAETAAIVSLYELLN